MTARPCSAMAAGFQHRHEAELAAGYLEDAGIRAMVDVEDAGGAYAGLSMRPNPARVLVRSEELREARRLLSEAGLTGEGGEA